MKCHYEVLNVPRDADDVEIKSAYRKLALKWHPDKNLDNSDYAKEQFQIVQQAYEVLSDKHERAWYDNHREQILRGSNSEFQDNSLDVFQYFGSCFKGYEDNENGFYTVYRNVFEKLAKEDIDFMEDKEEFCEIPNFGNSQTDYVKVAEFYAYWSNYLTKKSYVWLDPYNIKDIRERRYLKLVEKENKKVRQQAKKERNEEIRNLVAFVRKRDKRVQIQKKILEQKQVENKKKREQLVRDKKLERQQELNNSNVQPEWAKFDNFKSELEELEKNLAEEFGDEISNSDSEIEEDLNTLYCVACNKLFKTPKAFENHESSKKHKENVELLKATLLDEERNSQGTIDNEEPEQDLNSDDEVYDSDLDFHEETKLKNNYEKKLQKPTPQVSFNGSDMESDNIEIKSTLTDSDSQEPTPKSKKKRKQKNVKPVAENEHLENDTNFVDSDEDFSSSKKKKKGKRRNYNQSDKVKIPSVKVAEEQNASGSLEEEEKPKKTKKDRKNKKNDSNNTNDIDLSQNCLTCKSVFSSKNKLFDHLKKTGHGVYIDPNVKIKSKRNIKDN